MKMETYFDFTDTTMASPDGLKLETIGVSDNFAMIVDNTEVFYDKKIWYFNRLIVRKMANNKAARKRAFRAFVTGNKAAVMAENRANGGTGSHTAISVLYCVAALDADFREHIEYMAKCGPERSIVAFCREYLAKYPDGIHSADCREFLTAADEYAKEHGKPLV